MRLCTDENVDHLYAYTLELSEELKGIHSTFHVSNLKKCLVEGDIVLLMNEIQLDDNLHMIEEPVEVVDREVKRLKQSRIPIIKVRWNSQKGPEFTWECEVTKKKATMAWRITNLKKDVKELKIVDHSATLFSTIKSKVPNAIKEYLGTSLDDALHKLLLRYSGDITKEHSSPAEIVKRLR
nr:putative reverse transcriptase domain, ribonuclease H-like domain protein [Tanacetum cinerariifolium]